LTPVNHCCPASSHAQKEHDYGAKRPVLREKKRIVAASPLAVIDAWAFGS